MSFADLNFIFRFLPIFLIIYYIVPAAFRVFVITGGSLVFCWMADPASAVILAVLSVLTWYIGRRVIHKDRRALALGAVLLAGGLVAAKLLAAEVDQRYLRAGMSFYIFRMISYLADCYRGNEEEGPGLKESLAYFTMFPQLLSGPIMRYRDFLRCSALKIPARDISRKMKLRDIIVRIENGLTFFIPGLAFKVLIADHLASLAMTLKGIGYESISTPLAWLGVYAYSFELYYDFWGYSLMAAGIGIMLGFPFVANFDQPYSSKGVGEFYRRWHMTLGAFFRDNIYIPMGGSRRGQMRTYLNLFVVWLITGFWHGVTPNFIMWAMLVLLMIMVEKALDDRRSPLRGAVGRINVLFFIPLTWVVFEITDSERLLTYMSRLFPLFGTTGNVYAGDFIKYLTSYGIYLVISLVFLIPCVYHYFERHRRSPVISVVLAVLFALSVVSIWRAGSNPFLYLQF